MSYNCDYYNCEHPDYYVDSCFIDWQASQFELIAKEYEIDVNDMSSFEKKMIEEEIKDRIVDGYYV